MTTPFWGWRECCIFAMKTTLLQVSFLQSIVWLKCSTGTNLRNYIILFGEWGQLKEEWHCLQFCLQLHMLHFLWSTAALCRSNSKFCSFNIACTSTINWNITSRSARFLRIYEFSSCILWAFSRAIWSYCDGMSTKRKPYSEKNKKSCAKWITSWQWSI